MNHAFLNRSYSRDEFINFAKDFLPDFGYEESSVRISHNSLFNSAQTLGNALGGELAILEIAADSSSVGKRIAITKEAFKILRDHGMGNALVAFDDGHGKWRLSLLTTTLKLNDAGKVISEASNPRRYSYLLGVGAKTVTPYKYLIEKGKVENIKQLQERFSVEVVNKQFYASIANLFTKLVGGKRGATEYPGLLKIRGAVSQNIEHQEFAVRLIGRVIFGWFLKEKKSATGIPIVPNELLSLDAVASNADYYHSMLEPLFFELLNKRAELRHESLREAPFSTVPYLNGGLFSPQDNDFYNQNSFNGAGTPGLTHIPDSWFTELFTVLEQYNFTVDENTSYDVDLSIDPEMLGRIFENLLAEINPETGESARKSTGSFYTPREIVDYMVDSSLLEYLKSKIGVDEDKLKALISWDQDDDDDHPLTEAEKKNIVDALATLTILDPACGSGAFPIGILQKVVYILQQVDQEGKLWLEKQLAGNASPEFRRFLEQQNYDYIRKLGIIRESIFGVDIQTIATEISKLRCFLTLVIEEDVNDDMTDNRGIQPLPNLEFKFVTANSLIGLNESEKVALGDEKLDKLESRLFELRTKRYFQTKSSEEKAALRDEDKQLCLDILLATAGVVGINEKDIEKWERDIADAKNTLSSLESQFIEKTQGRLFGEDDVTQLRLLSLEENNLKQKILTLQSKIRNERKKVASTDLANKLQLITSWSPYDSSSSANFFDSKWMFGVDKFDIVIANPPYVGEKGHKAMFDMLKTTSLGKRFYKGKMDLFYFFFHLGLDILRDNGVLIFISTNYYLTATNADKLRADYKTRATLLRFVNFNELKIFESAIGQHNLITQLQKGESDINCQTIITDRRGYPGDSSSAIPQILSGQDEYTEYYSIPQSAIYNSRGFIDLKDNPTNALMEDITLKHPRVMDYYKVSEGLQTGNNNVFVFDGLPDFYDSLSESERQYIKPFYKNSDVKKYLTIAHATKSVLYIDKDFALDRNPRIRRYLEGYRDDLASRAQIKRSRQAWYTLLWPRDVKMFTGTKIVFPYRAKTNIFSLIKGEWFSGTDTYFVYDSSKRSLELCLAVLNSKLALVWLKNKGAVKGDVLELKGDVVADFPIPRPSADTADTESRIVQLVSEIVDNDQITDSQQAKLNSLVYNLYSLTFEEIAIIEKS